MNEQRFIELALTNEVNREILARLPELALPDTWLVSGSLFQTVWNALTGRTPDYGIKDYDIFYFDPDLSWEGEDAVIKRCAEAFADLGAEIEVRNQARVHLWYPEKFNAPYPPLPCSTGGIDRFLMTSAKVAIQPADGAMCVYAPRGFDDIEAMIVRPDRGPHFHPGVYAAKAARWKERWPELTVIEA